MTRSPKFIDRIFRVLERTEYKVARTPEEKTAIYRLRYQGYRREGTITPNASGLFSDKYDDCSNAWLISLHIDGELVGTMRIHVSDSLDDLIPALPVFTESVPKHLEMGHFIIDPTRFVTDLHASRAFPELPYLTIRVAAIAAAYFRPHYVLATPRAEHVGFYLRLYDYEMWEAERSYPPLTSKLACLATNCEDGRWKRFKEKYPFNDSTDEEQTRLFSLSSNGRHFARRLSPESAPQKQHDKLLSTLVF